MSGHSAGAAGRARVWIFQPRIEHYRLPVFDALRDRAAGRYELTVLGALKDGEAFGGGARPYLRECPERPVRRLGLTFLHWEGAEALLRAERPEVVVLTANLRSLSAWRLPGLCRSLGTRCIGWTKVHGYYSGLPDFVTKPFRRRFFERFERMILYGEQSLEELVQLAYPRERARVAHNTIDTTRIFREGDAIRERGRRLRAEAGLQDRRVLLCIGKMEPQKRLDDLLAAWPALRALDARLALVVVGAGPGLEGFRERAAAVDPDSIRVTGRVPEGDDYAWIATADAMLVPGAVGLAINQSLAFGCPTVVADERGADSEILEHGVTGWRYPRGDVDALVRTVGRILAEPEAAAAVAARGRARMRDEVTIDHMVDVLDAVLSEAIERGRP